MHSQRFKMEFDKVEIGYSDPTFLRPDSKVLDSRSFDRISWKCVVIHACISGTLQNEPLKLRAKTGSK